MRMKLKILVLLIGLVIGAGCRSGQESIGNPSIPPTYQLGTPATSLMEFEAIPVDIKEHGDVLILKLLGNGFIRQKRSSRLD